MNYQMLISPALRLRTSEIQSEFVGFLKDLNEEIVLDSIERLEEESGFRIRSHNAHGVLPDIIVPETGNRYEVLDRLDTETARLVGTIRERREATGPAAEPVVAVAKEGDTLLRAITGCIPLRVLNKFAS
jgi:hypothetical protein